jgi:hypothetical protein
MWKGFPAASPVGMSGCKHRRRSITGGSPSCGLITGKNSGKSWSFMANCPVRQNPGAGEVAGIKRQVTSAMDAKFQVSGTKFQDSRPLLHPASKS